LREGNLLGNEDGTERMERRMDNREGNRRLRRARCIRSNRACTTNHAGFQDHGVGFVHVGQCGNRAKSHPCECQKESDASS